MNTHVKSRLTHWLPLAVALIAVSALWPLTGWAGTIPTLNISETNYTVAVGDTKTFNGNFTDPDMRDVTDSYGASGSDSFTVTVKGAVPVVEIEGNAVLSIDSGNTVEFIATLSDPDSRQHNFLWTFGDGVTATGMTSSTRLTISHQFKTSPAEGLVTTLAVTDEDGNVGQAQVTVNIRNRNSDPCTLGIATIRSQGNRAIKC